MRRPNLKTVAFALTMGGLLNISVLGTPSLSSLHIENPQIENPREGLPGRRISGGSRTPDNACVSLPNQAVTALTPKSNLGLTLSGHPTFWVSLPAISDDRSLEFGLYDSTGELVYQTAFSASGKAEVVGLSLPQAQPALEVEQDYRWYLSVVCEPNSRSEDLSVIGWVRRVQPSHSLRQQLDNASTSAERLALYENAQIWYDTLTALAESRQSELTDNQFEQRWASLLESVGLSHADNIIPDVEPESTMPFNTQQELSVFPNS